MINTVTVDGRLTRDAMLSYTGNGTPKLSFSFAHEHPAKGDKPPKVSFFDVLVWGRDAEDYAAKLKKGTAVEITGRLEQDRWTDNVGGTTRSKVQIIAKNISILSKAELEFSEDYEEEEDQ